MCSGGDAAGSGSGFLFTRDGMMLLTENQVGREAEIVMLRPGELLGRGVIPVELGSRQAANGQTMLGSSSPVVTSFTN